MSAARTAITADNLLPEQLADLRQLHANPRFALQAQRRKAFVRAGLIRPSEDPRQPRYGRRQQPVRAHVLTELGERAIQAAPPLQPPTHEPLPRRPAVPYVSEAWARGHRAQVIDRVQKAARFYLEDTSGELTVKLAADRYGVSRGAVYAAVKQLRAAREEARRAG